MTPAPDSTPTPTPVTDLGWRGVVARAEGLASTAHGLWLRYTKHPLKRSIARAQTCRALRGELEGIAARAKGFPDRSDAALSGERAYIERRMVEIATLLERLDD